MQKQTYQEKPDAYHRWLNKVGPLDVSIPRKLIKNTKITVYETNSDTADRYEVVIGKAVYGCSRDASSPQGIAMYLGQIGEEIPSYHSLKGKKLKWKETPNGLRRWIAQEFSKK
jgi:hypothetical protein